MCAPEDAHYAAFGALQVSRAGEALQLHQHAVAVHSVFNCIPRDEYVTVQAGYRRVRDDESVAVVVQHKAALDFIAAEFARGSCGRCRLRRMVARASLSAISIIFSGQAVAASWEFFDEAALLESCKHVKQGAAVGSANVQAAGDFVLGGSVAPNLQETQNVIAAEI